MKPLLVVAACLIAGLAVGGIWTLMQPERYRADARLLVRPASADAVPAVEALAESSTVATNVAQTLRLGARPEIRARRGGGGVLTVSVEARERERARQIDAEAVTILQQKVEQRFASRLSVVLLDPAHAEEQTSPEPVRNLVICGLAGLVLGAVAARIWAQGTGPTEAARPRTERRLKARIAEVSRRELLMAKRAAELAARERALADREGRSDAAAQPTPASQPEQLEPPRQPMSVLEHSAGRWNLIELERLAAAQRDVAPERAEEWRVYLQLLRSHADASGNLPASFDGLLNDVFEALAPLRERGSAEP